ncbi:flagellar protein FlbD [Alicyclobacillaceae bacterium I2511]|nr:flagellar protein FlbD [Alicyclobacillaceae bacterium I2511]
MLLLTRLNGTDVWLNPYLMEAVEGTPDTVVTLNNGHKYVVRQTPEELEQLVKSYFRETGLCRRSEGEKDCPDRCGSCGP